MNSKDLCHCSLRTLFICWRYSIPCPIVQQGFWKIYYPSEVRRGEIFQNLYNLAGQLDTELPLPTNNQVRKSYGTLSVFFKKITQTSSYF